MRRRFKANWRICQTKEVRIEQIDSRSNLGLQVADFIAWSVGRKYEADDEELYDVIKDRIIVEETIEAK